MRTLTAHPGRGAALALSLAMLVAVVSPARAGAGDDTSRLVVGGLRLINGTQLYCESIGTGTPLVIVHGGPGLDHSYFLPQMAQLADSYELIFFDQRGCGRSTTRVDTATMTLNTLVEDIDKVRDAYNLETMNLMGHSWGGLLAMMYAIRHGDRLNSLILVNSTPAMEVLKSQSTRTIARRRSREDSLALAELMQTEEYQRRDAPAMQRYFRLLFRGTFRDPLVANDLTLSFPPDYAERSRLAGYLAKDPALMGYDILSRLDSITCPVLIIGSDDDVVPPESNELIHQHIPSSTTVVLKNCGHFPFVEAPGEFFPAVREFLERVQRR